MPTASSTLRRSCVFCRTRKIRCCGGDICTACRERNLRCVYGPEARKGRPKREIKDGTPVSSGDRRPSSWHRSGITRGDSLGSDLATSGTPDGKGHLATERTVGGDLEQMFDEYFIRKSGSSSNVFQNSIASFHQQLRQAPSTHYPPGHSLTISYDSLLSCMDQEMVEILLLRCGRLGCGSTDAGSRQFYVASLAMDTTVTMFDLLADQGNPISAMSKHRVLQLVEVWFSAHPLSPLVSKTLLAGDIKDNTVDSALLATILADACDIYCNNSQAGDGSHNGIKQGQDDSISPLRQFAISQLKFRPLVLKDPATLSTAQALALIGWRELCLGHARRGTCFIGYTCQIVSRLNQLWQMHGRTEGKRLNGVNAIQVEKEILQNIYWHCLSTTTWAFMHIDQPFSLLVPDETPDFPSPDGTTSAILHLDRASDNISTLRAQVQAMRRFWPLSHITSTVAHIYTLQLNASNEDTHNQVAPWQKQHVHRLHQLLQARFSSSMLLAEVREILLQAIQAVEREVTDIPSQSCLVITYHIIIMHMLFPKDRKGREREPVQLSQPVVQSFCHSASAILAIAGQFLRMPAAADPSQAMSSNGKMAHSWTSVLVLDTCTRGLLHIYEQSGSVSISEPSGAVMMRDHLADICEKLYQLCKEDMISHIGSRIRPMKKRLKQLKGAFRSLGTSTSPGLMRSLFIDDSDQPSFSSITNGSDHSSSSLDFPVRESLNSTSSVSLSDLIACSPPSGLHQSAPGAVEPGFFIGDPGMDSLLGFPGFTKSRNLDLHSLGVDLTIPADCEGDTAQDAWFQLENGSQENPLLPGQAC